ncbi:SulP family inorganic anion transporter [Aquimarina brevivitae]|uniref:SulP family sulfate permease n=1 Tax=Aquimarina brevivitae TaxID=323412 RepID=A0A4Q7P0T3_9FLAO|nr:solute carrier family 26 protein [Aquimarina brevivitae]RZS93295.1 SulP family sulfate permease [Aquimarina brevivitae]
MLKKIFPIIQWLPVYKKSWLSGDIAAGITVGIMLIPQGMAYAMIAGLPPVFGLYAALVPQVMYAFMGTSKQLAVGPVAMDSLLVASGLGALALSGIEEYIAMAIFLALFMGAIQLLLGLLRMGFLVNFLSKPVISGFTSAAAITIGMSQVKHLLGINVTNTTQLISLFQHIIEKLHTINLIAVSIGLISIFIILGLKKIHTKIPAALVIVILGIVATYFFNLEAFGLQIVGNVPEGLPSFVLPTLDTTKFPELFTIAITLALIAFMEAISVSKAIEEKHQDYEVDANQELIALGTANIVGSLFQSYPVTGGFSRTAVNDQAGAKTGVAALVSVLIVGLTLLFLTPIFYYLPKSILAAIIMVAVFGLIDISYPITLYKNSKDEFYLLLLTFGLTLLIGIKEGILIGVLASLLLLVYRTSKPHIAILGNIKGTDYFKNINRFGDEVIIDEKVLILRFDAQLYFGNKDYFKKELYKEIQRKNAKLSTVILNAESINYIDSSAIHMLKQVIMDLKKKNISFLVSGAIGPARDIIFSSGLIDLIGRNNLFVKTVDAYQYCTSITTKTELQRKIAWQNKSKLYLD